MTFLSFKRIRKLLTIIPKLLHNYFIYLIYQKEMMSIEERVV